MKILELIRLEESEHGTIGILKIDKVVFCYTLEPTDKLNKSNESSIPAQQYICEKIFSSKFGGTIQVLNVPGRSHILFHAGNVQGDTLGCILLGDTIGKLKGARAILNSGKTFRRFLDLMSNENQLHLTIREVY